MKTFYLEDLDQCVKRGTVFRNNERMLGEIGKGGGFYRFVPFDTNEIDTTLDTGDYLQVMFTNGMGQWVQISYFRRPKSSIPLSSK